MTKGAIMYFLVDLVEGATVLAELLRSLSDQGKEPFCLISIKGGKAVFWIEDEEDANSKFRELLRQRNIPFTETDRI